MLCYNLIMIKLLKIPFGFGMDIFRTSIFVRYVFSGGTSAAIDVALLYVLVEFVSLYYLSAAIIAMTVSFIARFLLQKYVTFQNRDEERATKQFISYSILYLASLGATAGFMYLFVDVLGMWYVQAQILSIFLIAAACFFIYKLFIFKK